jgi:hypothetical protein
MNPSDNPIDALIQPFFNLPADVSIFWTLMGILLEVGFFIYFLFALIVVRQVFLMSATFQTSAGIILKIFSFIHLFFAIAMLLTTFTVLF